MNPVGVQPGQSTRDADVKFSMEAPADATWFSSVVLMAFSWRSLRTPTASESATVSTTTGRAVAVKAAAITTTRSAIVIIAGREVIIIVGAIGYASVECRVASK